MYVRMWIYSDKRGYKTWCPDLPVVVMVQVLQVVGVGQVHHVLDHLVLDFPRIFSKAFIHKS